MMLIVNVVRVANSLLLPSIALFWLLLLSNYACSLAQQQVFEHDTSLAGSIVYRAVVKNMVGYMTYNMLSDNYDIINSGEFSWKYFDEGSVVLDSGQRYRMKVEPAGISFPDSTYILYAFYTNRLSYDKWQYADGVAEQVVVARGGGNRFPVIMNRGLVAVSWDNGRLIFVSGYLFLHDISRYFFEDGVTADKVRNYISIRYYNYDPSDIVISADGTTATFYSRMTFKRHRVDWKHIDGSGYKESISAMDDE